MYLDTQHALSDQHGIHNMHAFSLMLLLNNAFASKLGLLHERITYIENCPLPNVSCVCHSHNFHESTVSFWHQTMNLYIIIVVHICNC